MTRAAPYKSLAVFLVLAIAALVAAAPGDPPALLRVKIGTLLDPVTITASEAVSEGGARASLQGETRLSTREGAAMVGERRMKLPLTLKGSGRVIVDGEEFRGEVMLTADRTPAIINLIDVESYLMGVVNQEIDSKWPEPAVDAQVILARTYALKKAAERAGSEYDLDRTVTDQVYGGVGAEDELAREAVARTSGKVLVYGGRLVNALYHSCCGGRTELPGAVWGGADQPYQKSVTCNYCSEAPRYFWRFPESGAVSGGELAAYLGMSGRVSRVRIASHTGGGRAGEVEIEANGRVETLAGQEFRKRMGYEKIWSTMFDVESAEEGFVFRGSGSGHGAGLCQWGARGMALKGFSSKAILGYYFPGTEVRPWSRDLR